MSIKWALIVLLLYVIMKHKRRKGQRRIFSASYYDYRNFVQYQTIDIKELLKCGKNNIFNVFNLTLSLGRSGNFRRFYGIFQHFVL